MECTHCIELNARLVELSAKYAELHRDALMIQGERNVLLELTQRRMGSDALGSKEGAMPTPGGSGV